MVNPGNSPLDLALKECRNGLPLVALFSFFINLLILTSPLYMFQIYDRVLASGRIETLIFLTLIAGVAVLVMGLLDAIRGRLVARIGRWFERRLSPDLIATAMRGVLHGVSVGAQPIRDLSTIRGFLSGPAVNAFSTRPGSRFSSL